MPRLVDGASRTADVILAVNTVLASGGIPALTMRRIAAEIRLSPSALTIHYGSRERMLQVVCGQTGMARRRLILERARMDGVLAFIPHDADEIVDARAWLGWVELGRSADWLEPIITRATEAELALLARVCDYGLTRPDLEDLSVSIDGLLVAMCRPLRPTPPVRAREILRAHLRHLGLSSEATYDPLRDPYSWREA